MNREIKFEYGFESVNGIVKKKYYLHEIPNIKEKCDVWNVLPIVYVRQYTGLNDKNGKGIYEGDIVVKKYKDWFFTDDWEEDDIRWENTDLNIPLKEVNRDCVTLEKFGYWLKNETFGYEGEDLQTPSDYEIIGNIHENPELL